MIVERLQIAVGKRQESDIHLPLIALLALALQVHGHLCRDQRFEVVGGFQRLHLHVIVHHQKLVFQIGPGKGAAFYLGDAAVFQIVAQHLLHDHTDAAFALAAVALQQHHGLASVGGDEAVAQILLQGQNVLVLQKLR